MLPIGSAVAFTLIVLLENLMKLARFGSTAILVLTLLASKAAWCADWPQWLGPARNGTTSEIVAAWQEAPPVVWRRAVGNGYSSPIVADGIVIYHAAVADKDAE